MRIRAVQKLSVVDYPGLLCATVFTPGCNLRCPFCHNGSLVLENEPDVEEEVVFSFLESRKRKLDAVCLSGGEPLLQEGVAEFFRKVKESGFKSLSTNAASPEIPVVLRSHDVTVVPTLAPIIIAIVCERLIIPELTKPTSITVVADEL